MSSFVTYVDMLSCEVFFQIKEPGPAFGHGVAVAIQSPLDPTDTNGETLYALGSRANPNRSAEFDYQVVVKQLRIDGSKMNYITFDFCCGAASKTEGNTILVAHKSKPEIYWTT